MPVDPDDPTRVNRPVPPAAPAVPRQPLAAAPVGAAPVGVVDPAWAARADDRLRTLQTMLGLLSVLTLAALGLALWALTHDDDSGREGASRGRVAALTERVERLEDRPARTAPASGTADQASAADVARLQQEVDALKAQVEEGTGGQDAGGATAESVTALGTRVDQLAGQVDELRSSAAAPQEEATP